jgi:hypothetical protein
VFREDRKKALERREEKAMVSPGGMPILGFRVSRGFRVLGVTALWCKLVI